MRQAYSLVSAVIFVFPGLNQRGIVLVFKLWTLPWTRREIEAQGLSPHDSNPLSYTSLDSVPASLLRVCEAGFSEWSPGASRLRIFRKMCSLIMHIQALPGFLKLEAQGQWLRMFILAGTPVNSTAH